MEKTGINIRIYKCESRSALDCTEEIVIRKAEVPGCTPFYGRQESGFFSSLS